MPATDEPLPSVRADVWLWAARFFRTRSLARQALDGGKVEVGGAACKPSRTLRVGDMLRIVRGEERFEVQVLVVDDRRGPASVVQQLYRETEASRAAREAWLAQRRLVGSNAPSGRPDKRARRLIRALGDIDSL